MRRRFATSPSPLLLLRLLLLSQILPVSPGHIIQLFARVHALADADGLEIGAPQLLHQRVVAAQHVVVQTPVAEAERDGRFVGKGDAGGVASALIIVPVVPLGVVDEPRLVVETVGKMVGDESNLRKNTVR